MARFTIMSVVADALVIDNRDSFNLPAKVLAPDVATHCCVVDALVIDNRDSFNLPAKALAPDVATHCCVVDALILIDSTLVFS